MQSAKINQMFLNDGQTKLKCEERLFRVGPQAHMLAPGVGVAKVVSGFTNALAAADANVELNVNSLTSDLCISVRAGPVAIGDEHTHTHVLTAAAVSTGHSC